MRIEQLAERNILEYETKLKHMDELFGRAEKGVVKASNHLEISEQLSELREERTKLKKILSDYKENNEKYVQLNELEHRLSVVKNAYQNISIRPDLAEPYHRLQLFFLQ